MSILKDENKIMQFIPKKETTENDVVALFLGLCSLVRKIIKEEYEIETAKLKNEISLRKQQIKGLEETNKLLKLEIKTLTT